MTGYATQVTIGKNTYPTIAAAACAVGYSRQWLCTKIRRGDTNVHGIPMTYYDTMKSTRAKQVECIETGQIFLSATEASISIGKNKTVIPAYIASGKPIGGFHWRYIDEQ